jgi:hypothetical protein
LTLRFTAFFLAATLRLTTFFLTLRFTAFFLAATLRLTTFFLTARFFAGAFLVTFFFAAIPKLLTVLAQCEYKQVVTNYQFYLMENCTLCTDVLAAPAELYLNRT